MSQSVPVDKSKTFIENAMDFVGTEGATVSYYGRLLPEYPPVGFATQLLFLSNDGLKMASEIEIIQSQVRIAIYSSSTDWATLRNYANHQTQAIIDCIGLVNSLRFLLDIRTACLPDGTFVVYDNSYPALSAVSMDVTFEDITSVMLEEAIITVLGDFRSAMQAPADTGLYCYRAVEAIMQSFKTGTDGDKQGWNKMNAALNIESAYILDTIKNQADTRRHGASGFSITTSDRDKCLLATRTIFSRFCRFLQNGKQQLDPKNYSILK